MKALALTLITLTCMTAFAGEIEKSFRAVETQYEHFAKTQKAKAQNAKEERKLHDFEAKELNAYGINTQFLQIEGEGKAVSGTLFEITTYVQTPVLQRCRLKTSFLSDRENGRLYALDGNSYTSLESKCFDAAGNLMEKRQ